MTTSFQQYRGIANNYNQIVKALHTNFTEKKTLTFIYKLEQATIKLAQLNKQVIALTVSLNEDICRIMVAEINNESLIFETFIIQIAEK